VHDFVPTNLESLYGAFGKRYPDDAPGGVVIPIHLQPTVGAEQPVSHSDGNIVGKHARKMRFERLRNIWKMGKDFGAKLWRFFAAK
jgi:hypothetical protein